MFWVGKIIEFQAPAMDRDTFQRPSFSQAPTQPGLEQFQGWVYTTSLDSLSQLLTTFTLKNFLLIYNLNILIFILKYLVLPLHALEKVPLQLSLSWAPIRNCKVLWGVPGLLHSRLNNPSSPSLCSYGRCSRPQIIFKVLLWTKLSRLF